MSYATCDDGVKLYFEEAGRGVPIVFVHEFGGSYSSWEAQMRHFSRRHRCIAFAARGYPPSDIPDDFEMYSQKRAVADILAVMDHLQIGKANIVGLSMGGFATLHFGLTHPDHALSLVVAGAGYGAEKEHEEHFRELSLEMAHRIETKGVKVFAEAYTLGPSRVQLLNKNPRGWQEMKDGVGRHSATGLACTMRGVQARRPSIYDLKAQLEKMPVPTLVVTGDEDDHCLQPAIYMKRTIPACGLLVLPKTGHALNLEEPDLFNRAVADFIGLVEAGRWEVRDPRADPKVIARAS